MCASDAMRLCSSEIPNVDRITACMHRQRAALSERLQGGVQQGDAGGDARELRAGKAFGKPVNLAPARVK